MAGHEGVLPVGDSSSICSNSQPGRAPQGRQQERACLPLRLSWLSWLLLVKRKAGRRQTATESVAGAGVQGRSLHWSVWVPLLQAPRWSGLRRGSGHSRLPPHSKERRCGGVGPFMAAKEWWRSRASGHSRLPLRSKAWWRSRASHHSRLPLRSQERRRSRAKKRRQLAARQRC